MHAVSFQAACRASPSSERAQSTDVLRARDALLLASTLGRRWRVLLRRARPRRPRGHPERHARGLRPIASRLRGHLPGDDGLLSLQPLGCSAAVRVLQRLRRRATLDAEEEDVGPLHQLAASAARSGVRAARGRGRAGRPALLADGQRERLAVVAHQLRLAAAVRARRAHGGARAARRAVPLGLRRARRLEAAAGGARVRRDARDAARAGGALRPRRARARPRLRSRARRRARRNVRRPCRARAAHRHQPPARQRARSAGPRDRRRGRRGRHRRCGRRERHERWRRCGRGGGCCSGGGAVGVAAGPLRLCGLCPARRAAAFAAAPLGVQPGARGAAARRAVGRLAVRPARVARLQLLERPDVRRDASE